MTTNGATELPSVKPQKRARRKLYNDLPYHVTSTTAIDEGTSTQQMPLKRKKGTLGYEKALPKNGIKILLNWISWFSHEYKIT